MLPLYPDHVQQLSQHLLRRKILPGYCRSMCLSARVVRFNTANRLSSFCNRLEGMQSRTQGENVATPRILDDYWAASRA